MRTTQGIPITDRNPAEIINFVDMTTKIQEALDIFVDTNFELELAKVVRNVKEIRINPNSILIDVVYDKDPGDGKYVAKVRESNALAEEIMSDFYDFATTTPGLVETIAPQQVKITSAMQDGFSIDFGPNPPKIGRGKYNANQAWEKTNHVANSQYKPQFKKTHLGSGHAECQAPFTVQC